MSDLFSVQGKNVVLTGGAGVLGSMMAQDLAACGATVGIADYDCERATKVADEINAAGNSAFAIQMNVLEKSQVQKGFDIALEKMGSVDVLINAAGGNKKEATATDDMPFFDMPADALRWVFDLNLVGTILPSQVFGKHMVERDSGNILNVSSMSAYRPMTKVAAYSAAKAAISNFTCWLAVHMCKNYSTNIRVNAIAPGFFLTEQNRYLLTEEGTGELSARGKTIIDHTPMGRFGDPEDLCGTVRWLLSEASKFVTGTVIPVDGGFNAFSGV